MGVREIGIERKPADPRIESGEEGEGQPGEGYLDRRISPQLGDDPERLLAAGDALDVVERVAERLLPVLPARSCQMRRQDDVLQGEEPVLGCRRLIDHDFEPGSTDPVGGQRIIERVLVDHGPRQVLISIGIGFISPSSRAPISLGSLCRAAHAN